METLAWGERRSLTATVELEAIPEHVAADGMRTNNYAISSSRARIFFGGEVLDVDAVTKHARGTTAFDVAIGPVNGVMFKGRQLVTTAAEMATLTRALGATRSLSLDSQRACPRISQIVTSDRKSVV